MFGRHMMRLRRTESACCSCLRGVCNRHYLAPSIDRTDHPTCDAFYVEKSFFGACPCSAPLPYVFTGSFAADLSFSKYFTSSLSIFFIT